MLKVAYIQSIGGASGDMLLGALLDAGLPLETLKRELARLNVGGYALSAAQERRREMRGTKLGVELTGAKRYTPRSLLDTVAASDLPIPVKEQASRVLRNLWQAESRVHNEAEDVLELDELGSVDTLVDVVGFCIGLSALGVEQVHAAPLVLGEPTPPRRPGGYPNPAPATLQLLAQSGAPALPDSPVYEGAGELTTPTGAALITTLAQSYQRPAMRVAAVGVGIGGKDPAAFPNIVRVWLGEVSEAASARRQGDLTLLETNLDDVSGMTLGYTLERLFDLGALDAWHTSIQMKKNRPAVLLSALVPSRLEAAAVELIMQETPTLGVRARPVERYAAERYNVNLETELGAVSVKIKELEGKRVAAAPEYEDCRRIALERGLSFQEVYQRITEAARRQFL